MSQPERIGAYPVQRTLGAGAMGSVYLATHPGMGIPVAIKVLHDRDPDVVARFYREAQVMARIKHPNVVEVLEGGVHMGEPFLVMEYCEGVDLDHYVKQKGRVDPLDAAQLLAQTARGVAAAHAQGSVHRDLKPANVMLTGGVAKVTDFGIASALRAPGAENLTRTGVILGTPVYMAPEQLDDARAVDARSDVYALGAILFELLTGTKPFAGSSLLGVAQKVLAGQREPLPAGLPGELVEILDCAMSLDPADRYSSAFLLADSLEEFAAGRAGGSRGSGPNRVLLGLVGLATLGVGAALAVLAAGSGPSATPAPRPSATPSSAPAASVRPTPSASPSEAAATPDPLPELPEEGSRAFYQLREELWGAPIKRVAELARRGYPDAQRLLAVRYFQGEGVPKSRPQAVKLWEQAAAGGSLLAKARVAQMRIQEGKAQEGWAALEELSAQGLYTATEALARRAQDPRILRLAVRQAKEAAERGDPNGAAFAGERHLLWLEWEAAEEWLQKGIELGSRLARLSWADLRYADPKTTLEQRERALRYYEEGVAEGRSHALASMAWVHFEGLWVPHDEERARIYAARAAKAGDSGQGYLAQARIELRKNALEPAKALLKRAGAEGRTEASAYYGLLLYHESMGLFETDPKAGFAKVKQACALLEHGVGWGMLCREGYFRLGFAYHKGLGVPLDLGKSAALFEKAAKFGSPIYVYAWADCLLFGKGVAPDGPRAVRLLEEVAPRYPMAYWRLGLAYKDAVGGVAEDLVKARETFERGAEAKDPECMHELGRIAERASDYTTARRWYDKSAKLQNHRSMLRVAVFQIQGKGGPHEPEAGQRLLLAVARVYPVAAQEVARRFEEGDGFPKDPARAAEWRRRAKALVTGAPQ